jgi:hypothetical protein
VPTRKEGEQQATTGSTQQKSSGTEMADPSSGSSTNNPDPNSGSSGVTAQQQGSAQAGAAGPEAVILSAGYSPAQLLAGIPAEYLQVFLEHFIDVKNSGRLPELIGKLKVEKKGKWAASPSGSPDQPQGVSSASTSRYTGFVKPASQILDPNDPTSVKDTKVTVATTLEDDGTNFTLWERDLEVACGQKGEWCGIVLSNPMPRTAADAAVQFLIRSSTSSWMASKTKKCTNACELFMMIKSQYKGGLTLEAAENNMRWERELRSKRMLPTERIRDFVQRKADLVDCLRENGYNVLYYTLPDNVFGNLPAQFSSQVSALATAHSHADATEIVTALERAANRIHWIDGVGPQQPLPQPPRIAAVTAPTTGVAREPKDLSHVRCYACGQIGHYRSQCPQRNRGSGEQRRNGARGGATRPMAGAVSTSGEWQQFEESEEGEGSGNSVTPRVLSIVNNVFDPGIRAAVKDDWSVDTGATIILTNNFEALHEPTVHSRPRPIYLATNAVGGTVATGSLCLKWGDRVAWLHNVHCDPQATQNLLSVSAAVSLGFSFHTNERGEYTSLSGPQGHFCYITKKGGLYNLEGVTLVYPARGSEASVPVGHADILAEDDEVVRQGGESVVQVALRNSSVGAETNVQMSEGDKARQRLHEQLGHLNADSLNRLIKDDLVEGLPRGLPSTGGYAKTCETCIMGKGTQLPYKKHSDHPATRPLQRIHLDTAYMKAVPGVCGEQYFVTVLEEWSGWKEVLVVQNKAQIPGAVKACLLRLMNKKQCRIEQIRTDRGTEFFNTFLKGWTDSLGIDMQASCARSSPQNGKAERCIRTIKDMARTMMVGTRCSLRLWPEAVRYAADVSNCLPVSGKKLTPHHALWNEKPNISNLKKWGCRAYIMTPKQGRHALQDRYTPGMFVGLEKGTKGWRVRLPNRSTEVTRNVRFVEEEPGVVGDYAPISLSDLSTFLSNDSAEDGPEHDGVIPLGPEDQWVGLPSPPLADDERQQHPVPASTQCSNELQRPMYPATASSPTIWSSAQLHPTGGSSPAAAVGNGPAAEETPNVEPRSTQDPRQPEQIKAQLPLRRSSRLQRPTYQVAVTPCKPSERPPVRRMMDGSAPAPGGPGGTALQPRGVAEEQGGGVSSANEAAAQGSGSTPSSAVDQAQAPASTSRPPPRRSERIRAQMQRRDGITIPETSGFFPDFHVEPGTQTSSSAIITNGNLRYHIPSPTKGLMSSSETRQLCDEMSRHCLREGEAERRDLDPSADIPRHTNLFEVLEEEAETGESEEVNITDFTGREDQVSEVDITGVTTEWDKESEEPDPIAHLIKVQHNWVGSVPCGKKSCIKQTRGRSPRTEAGEFQYYCADSRVQRRSSKEGEMGEKT